jgi:glycosyltransferase involved in cell wall biosynthesis
MRSRIAILRGEWLNPFELQSYEPLVSSYDLVGIGARNGSYDLGSTRMPVVRLRPAGRGRIARRILGDRSSRLLGLERNLLGYAVVHSAETFLPISEQAARAQAQGKFKLVLTCWENIPFLYEDNPRVAARKQVVRDTTDLFLAVTDGARQALLLENVPSEQIIVQPVGVDRRVFRPTDRDEAFLHKWAVPEGWTTVLYCGRLIREKGVLDLARAMVRLPRTVLILAGDGPERRRLEAAAVALGVHSQLRFVGGVAYGEMPGLYSAADVLCLPSVSTPYWQEQFGMVLVEALACGVPVVTTATGSIPEVVGDAAVLVPAYAPDELAGALARLLGDRPRRTELVESGLQRVAERYDAAKVAASIGEVYERLLE